MKTSKCKCSYLGLSIAIMFTTAQVLAAEAGYRRLPVAEFRDKMTGAWLGQMIGVGWGAPTEVQFQGDFSGIISPEMPRQAIALGDIFGRLRNYGDGRHAGQFIRDAAFAGRANIAPYGVCRMARRGGLVSNGGKQISITT